jgi:hypothetical protein
MVISELTESNARVKVGMTDVIRMCMIVKKHEERERERIKYVELSKQKGGKRCKDAERR